MKKSDLKGLSTTDLKAKASEEKALLTKLKLNHAVSPLENPLKIRAHRRNVAKMVTELNSRKGA